MENLQIDRKINVFRNTLHAISLLCNNNDEKWNFKSLEDIIKTEDPDIKQNKIANYLNNIAKDDFDIDYDTIRGSRSGDIGSDIDDEQLKTLLRLYSTFVITDLEKDVILKRLKKSHPHDSLWVLARIHFAIINKQVIKFDYITNRDYAIKQLEMLPYYMVMKNNNLYLIGKDLKDGQEKRYILSRVQNLNVTEITMKEVDIPEVEEFYKNVLGSYASNHLYKVKLKFENNFQTKLEEIIDSLDYEEPEIYDDEFKTIIVTIDDVKYLCEKLFIYGKSVEILEPKGAREIMVEMLRESCGVYL